MHLFWHVARCRSLSITTIHNVISLNYYVPVTTLTFASLIQVRHMIWSGGQPINLLTLLVVITLLFDHCNIYHSILIPLKSPWLWWALKVRIDLNWFYLHLQIIWVSSFFKHRVIQIDISIKGGCISLRFEEVDLVAHVELIIKMRFHHILGYLAGKRQVI